MTEMQLAFQCPRCGAAVDIAVSSARKKGEGKGTAVNQRKLSSSQMVALTVLKELRAMDYESSIPMKQVWSMLKEKAKQGALPKFPTTHDVGFWLSVLGGAGFATMYNKKCELRDFETHEIRFAKKPCWALSREYQQGEIRLLADGTIVRN